MSAFFYIAAAFVVTLFLLYRKLIVDLIRFYQRSKVCLESIPGPPALPLIGCAHQFDFNNEDFTYIIERWIREYLLGARKITGLMKIWVGPVPLVVCGTAESIRPIMESHTLITKPVQYNQISEWIGTGLLTSTGEKWHRRRKMLTPTFHFNVLQSYMHVFARQGEVITKCLEKEADTDNYFDIFPYIKRCALDIICETAMGTEINTQMGMNQEYLEAVVRISRLIWDHERFPWLWVKPVWYGSGMGREFDRLVKLTNDFTRKVIAERKQAMLEEEGFQHDLNEDGSKKKLAFLDMMLAMQHEKGELSDEDIREEVDTFMFEGHDTTSSGMGFTIWFLGQEPECQKKCHDELDKVFGDSDRVPTYDDLKQCVYLEKCVKEALRLMPSVPLIARELSHDIEIEGHVLPKGMTTLVVPMTTHRDPRHYDTPEDFNPEHFSPEKTAGRDPYAYIPFSAGLRNCIGQKFAIMEEKAVLSQILRKYRVETQEPWPGNRPLPEIILKPSHGFGVKLFKR